MKIKAFVCIDGLRAWMAWWVVVGHALQLASAPAAWPVSLVELMLRGYSAVNVFVMVSGFVITHLVLSRQEPYLPYITRRLLRIAPVYLCCLAAALLLTSAYAFTFVELPFATERGFRAARMAHTEAHLPAHLLAHASLLHGAIPSFVLPYAGSSILPPAWSLSLEWQFYLVAPLLILALAGRALKAWLTLGLMFGLFLLSSRYLKSQYEFPSLLFLSIKYFIIGIATRLALERVTQLGRRELAVAAVAAAALIWHKPYEGPIWVLWTIFCALEAGLLRPWPRLEGPLDALRHALASNAVITALGRWSYSTYLVHVPLFALVVYGLAAVWGRPEVEAMRWWVAGAMLLLPGLSAAMYALIERPGIQLGARLARWEGRLRAPLLPPVPLSGKELP